jgi:hypothetical protein
MKLFKQKVKMDMLPNWIRLYPQNEHTTKIPVKITYEQVRKAMREKGIEIDYEGSIIDWDAYLDQEGKVVVEIFYDGTFSFHLSETEKAKTK